MKKFLLAVLVIVIAVAMCIPMFVGCGDNDNDKIKIGLICLHDKNATYDKNFINALERVQAELNLSNDQIVIATGIPEGEECYNKAIELAENGCDIVIGDSFGFEPYMIRAAQEKPNVLFAHCTGVSAAKTNLDNFVNAFASIYEGRYLAGIAAGLKLNEMIEKQEITASEAKMGYIGAFTYAEVISGYTSFYLGAKSVCPSVTMDVTFTGSWYDYDLESQCANNLIENKDCVLISQHADSMGAPNACEEAGVPDVSYNGSTLGACPNTFVVSSCIKWDAYYKYLIECVQNGTTAVKDYVGTIQSGSVALTEIGTAAATGTAAAIDAAKAELVAGTRKVFDVTSFKIKDGETYRYLTTDDAGVKTAGGITYYAESDPLSAPSFAFEIEGITRLDVAYGD